MELTPEETAAVVAAILHIVVPPDAAPTAASKPVPHPVAWHPVWSSSPVSWTGRRYEGSRQ